MIKRFLNEKMIKCIFFLFYSVGYIIISMFHEPWFDEAQAWQIAKCANLKEILFVIPHYEGHPPLWHLILAIPAKLDIPFEIGLKTIGFLFSVSSAALILFKSKLPLIAKLLLPFSYHFFYQYGIIVRPYCMMLLIMIILGIVFNKWNEYPWLVIFLLAVLCLTCAYGIVLAGGIAICMVYDLYKEKRLTGLLKDLLIDHRLLALLFLFIFSILLISEIIPREDTYTPLILNKNPLLKCLVCALLTFPGECFFTTSSWFSVDHSLLQNARIPILELIVFCFVGLLFWLLIICFSSRKNLKLLIIPYSLFAIFSSKVYFTSHHLGIVLMFLLFWLEIQYRDVNCFEIGYYLSSIISKNERDRHILKKLMIYVCCICLIIPIYWNVTSSKTDATTNYCFGREAALFLKNYNLDDKLVLTDWSIYGSIFPQSDGFEDYINPYINATGTLISAYFSRNISLDLNSGNDLMAYTFHKNASYFESLIAKDKWKLKGRPDVIIGKPKLDLIYKNSINYSDYSLVKIIRYNYIWKIGKTFYLLPIFIHNSLISQLDIEPITGIEAIAINGIAITEEMKNQFAEGVPLEEILKPYFDAMFE